MHCGRTEKVWEELTDAGHEFLKDVCRREDMTTYTDLNKELVKQVDGFTGFDSSQQSERAAMGYPLGRIVDRDQEGNPDLVLTAVVHYIGMNSPGPGFFDIALAKGNMTLGEDKDSFWSKQVSLAQTTYPRRRLGTHRPGQPAVTIRGCVDRATQMTWIMRTSTYGVSRRDIWLAFRSVIRLAGGLPILRIVQSGRLKDFADDCVENPLRLRPFGWIDKMNTGG